MPNIETKKPKIDRLAEDRIIEDEYRLGDLKLCLTDLERLYEELSEGPEKQNIAKAIERTKAEISQIEKLK